LYEAFNLFTDSIHYSMHYKNAAPIFSLNIAD
jgi:hypothetical protein